MRLTGDYNLGPHTGESFNARALDIVGYVIARNPAALRQRSPFSSGTPSWAPFIGHSSGTFP